jgi:anaerobic magnesium-protoporphyrin IX monomethyl ester cyclase
MKVALIAPPYPLEEAPSPPLGICYVAASFEAAGAVVRIFDYIVRGYTPEKLKSELDDFKPDVVGTNSVTMNFYAAAGILKTAKEHDPSLITVMGGPHVSFDAENTLRAYPEIDLVVIGESEETLKELIPVLHDKTEWWNIRGLAFLEKGELVKTGERPFLQDLDTLPLPARHLLPASRYQALGFPVSIITSRGCPNRCIFCQGRRMVGMKVRYRSARRVADEIENILSFGYPRINIADDFFTSNKKRVKLFCDEITKRGLSFSWSAFARVDSCSTEVLETMKNAGCDTVSFGIESGNPEMLKRIQKGITLDQARKAVAMCKETGMGVFLSFMAGLPGETRETLEDSRAFAKELGVPMGYHYLAPFPGTTLWEKLDAYDLEILTGNWDRYDANQAITRTSSLSDKDINAFVGEFEEEIERCWQDMLDRYRQGTCTDYERFRIEGRERMQFIFRLFSQDIIEKYGKIAGASLSNGHLSGLVSRLSEVMDVNKGYVESTIGDLAAKGYLKCREEDDATTWFWPHNPKMDELPLAAS